MDDIRQPRPPQSVTPPVQQPVNQPLHQPQSQQLGVPAPLPIEHGDAGLQTKKPKNKKKIVLFAGLGVLLAIILVIGAGIFWCTTQLSAVGKDKNELIKVTIEDGTTPNAIGKILKDSKVIKNDQAFSLYTRITKTQNKLQAGVYRLSPAETTPEIVKHLTDGNVDTFSITFLPGATLAENKQVLLKAGFAETKINAALAETYDSPLFDTKPATADLEGYIYGETYTFSSDATVEDVLNRTFAQYEKVITDNGLVAKFQSHGLSLYQGVTLASIIQREAVKGDEPQIAQVFYTRLSIDMPLGSDVTYQYIADKTGVARDPNLDSPYNTRRYTGLPPGPIAVPGLAALEAVADPAAGDYIYFLSGDDNVTYYAHTLAEHEANIAAHCKVKCSTL